MFIHIFFLTVRTSRATDYDEGYIKIDQQTQTVVTCKCYKKAKVYGCTWDDDAIYLEKNDYKRNDLQERDKAAKVEFSNPIHIPQGKVKDRLR